VADIFGIEPDKFDEVVMSARFPIDEFIATATPVPPSLDLNSYLLMGWLAVERRSVGIAQTCNASAEQDWPSFFKRDRIAGIFGGPADS